VLLSVLYPISHQLYLDSTQLNFTFLKQFNKIRLALNTTILLIPSLTSHI